MKKSVSIAAAVWLALDPSSSFAQIRVNAAAEVRSIGSTAANPLSPASGSVPGAVPPRASLSLSLSPSLCPSPVASAVTAVPAAEAVISAAVADIAPVSVENASRKVAHSVAVQKSVLPLRAPLSASARFEEAAAVVRDEVASWGGDRHSENSVLAPSPRSFASLSPTSAPNPGSPRLAKAALISGAVLIGAALAAPVAPALVPPAFAVWKGAFAWAGLSALAASRFWRTPGEAPDVPRGPPAPAGGAFSSFKSAWAAARDSADAQKSFETRVGGSSWPALRDWLLGGLRTGLYWMAPALLLMLGGAIVAKAGMLAFGVKAAAAAAAGGAADASPAVIPMSALLGDLVPMALAAQAAGVALYFAASALARKLGAGWAAPWLGGAAALGLAGGVLLTLTEAPFVIAVSLAIEAGVIWSAARSRSFVVPLALRGVLTLFSLEAARLAAWLNFGAAGALAGLPAAWGGVAVAGLVALAWRLKSPGLRLAEIGAWWKADEPGQRPKSPGRVLSAGLVWGLVVYAIGDLIFWGVNALAPGREPAPAILAKMLTSSVDLVLYNFVLVGLLEEYVFRRGLFKMMNDKLDKWGLSPRKAFWLAAIGSALIFSGAHYIDWGALPAKIGMGDPAASSGLGGAYDFSWAGFVARSALGVVLAWMYKRSGLLLIPIVAHVWADSMEGLGLRWGLPAFLALAAGALALSFLFRAKAPRPNASHLRPFPSKV